jgi:hypothetical protein
MVCAARAAAKASEAESFLRIAVAVAENAGRLAWRERALPESCPFECRELRDAWHLGRNEAACAAEAAG